MTLFDLLDESATASTRVVFPSMGQTVAFGAMWTTSARVAAWVRAHVDEGNAVATLLDTSPECLAFFLGTMRSGRRTASLPLPPRSSSLDHYERIVRSILLQGDASLLVVDQRIVAWLPPLPIPVISFQDAVSAASAMPAADDVSPGGELVQFTSGSTARPKGVRLSIDQISANVSSILDRLAPEPGDGACSWLPLSHDMGLIGMTLSSLAAGGQRYSDGGDLVLIPPEHFLRNPRLWLEVCSHHRSTITATPDFGLGMAMRRRGSAPELELGRLRACIVGGEPIRAETLKQFSTSLASFGFRGEAFCPSYGLAEATLGVTMVAPDERWRTVRLDRDALASGLVTPTRDGGVVVVSSGTPLDGVTVSVDGAGRTPGAIGIEGPNVFAGYLGACPAQGRLETSDEGFVLDGHLYVLGRADDVLVVRGRNLHATDLEEAVEQLGPVRSGSCVVVDESPGYAVVLEAMVSRGAALRPLGDDARRALVDHCGVAPQRVLIVDRGVVPKTSSGKKQRRELARRLAAGEVDTLHESRFVPS